MKHSNIHIGKHFSISSPIQNGLKHGDALSLLLFNSDLEYSIRKVQKYQVGLKLNGTHNLLSYADDMNLLGDNTDTINTNTETLIDASKEAGVGVNTEEANLYVGVSSPECRSELDINIANRSFENVSQLKYSGTTVTNQNCSDNTYYH
jgi:hypothetical protein